MIRNLSGKITRDVYDGLESRHSRKLPRELHGKARRLLDQINAALALEVLFAPPANRLEKLHGDRIGYWSLRINNRWRIVFQWEAGAALNVEIIDFH